MENVRIGCSPLSNKIYIGKVKRDKKLGVDVFSGKKSDVTMECLIAVIEHCMNHGSTVQITKTDGTVDFEIDVKDLRGD